MSLYFERGTVCSFAAGRRTASVYKPRSPKESEANKKKKVIKPKVWYNRRSPASLGRIIETINKIYNYESQRDDFDSAALTWLTLTTVQSITLATDKYLFSRIKLLFQHEKFGYLCISERQRTTGDLHFHCVLQNVSFINIPELLDRWARLLGVEASTNLVNVARIYDLRGLRFYISKYISKPCPSMEKIEQLYAKFGDSFNSPYSSLFQCRGFSSGRLNLQEYQPEQLEKFIIPTEYLVHLDMPLEYGSFYSFTYNLKYSDELNHKAWNLYKLLSRAGLVGAGS